MAQAVETPETVSVASGATDLFATVWTFERASEVVVEVDVGSGWALQEQGVAYEVTDGDWRSVGGDVRFLPGYRPPAGARVGRRRFTAAQQTEPLGDLETFRPLMNEGAFDRLTRMIQEGRATSARALTVPMGEAPPVLPAADGRPGNGLFFDAEDRPYWGLPFFGGPISAFFQSLLTAANGALVLFGLGVATPGGWGAKGDGVADDTAALNLAGASGRKVSLMGRTYRVTDKVVLRSGTRFVGPGKIVASALGANPWIVEIAAGDDIHLIDVEIDGAALGAAVAYGVRANGSTQRVRIKGCGVRNLGFTGIDLSAGGGDLTHIDAHIHDNIVENVGWTGINTESTFGQSVARNTVRRTGYHGIFCTRATDGVVSKNYVTKAEAPTYVYDGPGGLGGVEGGFLIGYDPTVNRLIIDSNVCDDNRTAGYDGIGVGEDGVTEFGPTVISNNIVRRAGLFGIDPVGNVVVVANFVDGAKEQGIHIGLDLGGILRNVLVSSNIVRNTGDTPGKIAILVGDTLGPPLIVRGVRVVHNLVVDTRAVRNTQFAVTVVCDEATYEGLAIIGNDLSGVADVSFSIFGANGPGADYEAWGNKCVGDERIEWAPVVTTTGGALGGHTPSGRYQRVGKTVQMRGRLQIAAVGTATGAIRIALPTPARPGSNFPVTVMAGNLSEPLYGVVNGAVLTVSRTGGATAIAAGADLFFAGEYEAAA